MKLRTLCFLLALMILSLIGALHVGLQAGFAAGLVSYVVADFALMLLIARRPGMLFATTNSLGTLAATGVFHDALGLLLKRLPFLKRIAKDVAPTMGYINMPFNVAQTLKNYNASMTVSDRNTTGTYAKQAGVAALADQTFTLTQWPFISIMLTLQELNSMVDSATNKDARNTVIMKLMERAFNALGLAIVNRAYSVITAGNYALTGVNAVGNMDWKKLGSLVDVFLQNDALIAPPDAILEIVCYRELVNSLTNIANASFSIEAAMRDGVIQEALSGASSISRYNVNMPADAARGVLFGPEGLLFANRIPMEETLPNDPVFQTIITEPETGFSVLLREAKDPLTGEVTRTLTTLFDFGVGLASRILRITAA